MNAGRKMYFGIEIFDLAELHGARRNGWPRFSNRCLKPLSHPSKLLIIMRFFTSGTWLETTVATQIATEPPQLAFSEPTLARLNAASILAAASSCIVAVTCE